MEFTMYFENGIPKGTSQQKGEFVRGGHIYHYKKPSVALAHHLYVTKASEFAPERPSEAPVRLELEFIYSVKDQRLWGHYKPSKPDADNICKELIDSLVDAGHFVQDSRIVDLRVIKKFGERASIRVFWEEIQE